MTLEEFTAEVRESVRPVPSSGKTVKLTLKSGIIYIDLSKDPGVVTNEDKDADVEVITTLETLMKLRTKATNPMMALMAEEIKIKGDVSVVLMLQSILL